MANDLTVLYFEFLKICPFSTHVVFHNFLMLSIKYKENLKSELECLHCVYIVKLMHHNSPLFGKDKHKSYSIQLVL